MCVCMSVYVCRWMAKERILSSASLDGIRLSRRSSFVCLFWHKDHTKRCARMNPDELA